MSAPLRKAPRRAGSASTGSVRDTTTSSSGYSVPVSPATPMGPSPASPTSSVGGYEGAGSTPTNSYGYAAGGRLFRRGLGGAGGGAAGSSNTMGGSVGVSDTQVSAAIAGDDVDERSSDAANRTGQNDLGAALRSSLPQHQKPLVSPGSSVPTRHRASGLAGLGGVSVGSGRLHYGSHSLLREACNTLASSRASTPTGSVASLPLGRGVSKHEGGLTATRGGATGIHAGSPSSLVGGSSLQVAGSSNSVNSVDTGVGVNLSASGVAQSNFTPLPTRLRLSDGISCMDYHPTFRVLAVGGTRQIHVVEVSPNVAVEVCQYEQQHLSNSNTACGSSRVDTAAEVGGCPLPPLASATAPFGFRNTGTFGGLVKVESVVWYPSAAEASLAFVQPSRVVTILLDALAFKADGSYMPQQWIRSRCKSLTAPTAAGSGSTSTAIMNIPGGINTMQTTTTSAGSASTSTSATTTARSPGAATTSNSTTVPSQAAPSGPWVSRNDQRPTGRELIELNIDITYMRVEKIVWDPHTPYTLALSSPLTLFELWQVPVHGDRVFAPQLILRPPAHLTRVTVRDIEFSPSDPNLIVVTVETASAGQLLLFDRRQVEIPRHVDVMGPALAAAFHPLFADLLAVCYRKEKAKTDCRIAFLRVMHEDTLDMLHAPVEGTTATAPSAPASMRRSHSAGRSLEGGRHVSPVSPSLPSPSGTTTSASAVRGMGDRSPAWTDSIHRRTASATLAASVSTHPSQGAPTPTAAVGSWSNPPSPVTPPYPHVVMQDVLPPIDYYACVNRLLWRPTSCGELSCAQADHPWLTFVPDAHASAAASLRSKSARSHSRSSQTGSVLKLASTGVNIGQGDMDSKSEADMGMLGSQLWLATSAIANDLDVNVWDATNGYLPVCSVQYPTRDGREATNDFIWINEVTLVSAVRGNEIVVSSLLSNTHLDRTVRSALHTSSARRPKEGSTHTQTGGATALSNEGHSTDASAGIPLTFMTAPRSSTAEPALAASADTASRISTLYAFLPTSSIVANWFGHVIAVRNSASTVRRHYGDVMRLECGQLIRRLVVQLKREYEARQRESDRRNGRPALRPPPSTPASPVEEDGPVSERQVSEGGDGKEAASLGPQAAHVDAQPAGPAVSVLATTAESTMSESDGSRPATSVEATHRVERHHNKGHSSFFSRLFGSSQPRTDAVDRPTGQTPSSPSRPSIRAGSAPATATTAAPNATTTGKAALTAPGRRGSPTFPARRPFPQPSGLDVSRTAGAAPSPLSPAGTTTTAAEIGTGGNLQSSAATAAVAGTTPVHDGRLAPRTSSSPMEVSPCTAAQVAGTVHARTFLRLFPLLECQQVNHTVGIETTGLPALPVIGGTGTQPSSPTAVRAGRTSTVNTNAGDHGGAGGDHVLGGDHHSLTSFGRGASGSQSQRKPVQFRGADALASTHSTAYPAAVDAPSYTTSVADVTALAPAATAASKGRPTLAPSSLGPLLLLQQHLNASHSGVRPSLESFVVSDVVCNWAYAERETEKHKFMLYALQWDMGYELALIMKRLRRCREDVLEVMAASQQQQQQQQQQLASQTGDRGWRRGPGAGGGAGSVASPVLPTAGSRGGFADEDPSWRALGKGLLTPAGRGNGTATVATGVTMGEDARVHTDPSSRALFTATQVDDLFAAMMLKNASTCAEQESCVAIQQRQEARALGVAAAAAAATAAAATSDLHHTNRGETRSGYRPTQSRAGPSAGPGALSSGKMRAVTNDPRAQWWRAVAHAWRTHNLPFILAVTIGQLEYASLAGDVQYCTVLHILFCLWWRLRHEEADAAPWAIPQSASRREGPPVSGEEMASYLSGPTVTDPASVERAWVTHRDRLREANITVPAASGETPRVAAAVPPSLRTPSGVNAPCPLCSAPNRPVPQNGTPNTIAAAGTTTAPPPATSVRPDTTRSDALAGPAGSSAPNGREANETTDFLEFALQLSLCTPEEWKLRALQWLGAYTNALYALRLYVPLNELLLIVPEILQESTNPIQPRAADISYEKQMTYVCCGTCPKSELMAAAPRGSGVEPVAGGRAVQQGGAAGMTGGSRAAPLTGLQRGLLDPLMAIRQAALETLRLHQQRRGQQRQQRWQRGDGNGRRSTGVRVIGGRGRADSVLNEEDDTVFSDRSSEGSLSSDPYGGGRGGGSDDFTGNPLPYTTSSDDDDDHVPTPIIIELPAVVAKSHHKTQAALPTRTANEGPHPNQQLTAGAAELGGSGLSATADRQRTGLDANAGTRQDPDDSADKDVASCKSTCASEEEEEEGHRLTKASLNAHTLERAHHGDNVVDKDRQDDDDDGGDSTGDEAGLAAVARRRGVGEMEGRVPDDDALSLEDQDNADTAVALTRGHRLPENAVCPNCHDTQAMRCVVCEEVVEGLFYWLRSCGHGGHVQHMEEWLQLADECPRCGVPVSEVMRAPA